MIDPSAIRVDDITTVEDVPRRQRAFRASVTFSVAQLVTHEFIADKGEAWIADFLRGEVMRKIYGPDWDTREGGE